MVRRRRIARVAVVGGICFAVGLVLIGLAILHSMIPFVPIGVAVVGIGLVGTAMKHRTHDLASRVDDGLPNDPA